MPGEPKGGTWRPIVERALEQQKGGALWIFYRGPAANGWDILRRTVQLTSSLFDAFRIRVDVIDPDESNPGGLHSGVQHRLIELKHSGGVEAAR